MLSINPYMPHYCGNASRFHEARRNYAAGGIVRTMQERQKVIAEWMRSVMDRRDLSARKWAELASLGKDTVSRAIRDDYPHVTSTTTIAKLAEVVNERPPGLAGAIPSVAVLVQVVAEIQRLTIGTNQTDRDLTLALAEALRDTLLHLADEPEDADDPRVVLALARASIRQRQHQPA
jgi:hypothetical protein